MENDLTKISTLISNLVNAGLIVDEFEDDFTDCAVMDSECFKCGQYFDCMEAVAIEEGN